MEEGSGEGLHHFNRVVLVVLDSVGIGELPDAHLFGDKGCHTLGHIGEVMKGLAMPYLQSFGLGNIEPIRGVPPHLSPLAYHGKMKEISRGKDTTTGHWELMGIHTTTPFKTYPNGFPNSLIKKLEQRLGRYIIGNKPASGTEIIQELGERHVLTGDLIVYTSADSVLQIAAHEEVVPLNTLYDACLIARELTLQEEYLVVRVIARPFIGQAPHYTRTANRKDFSIKPPSDTVLNTLENAGLDVIGIGKISDIFNGEGITHSFPSKSNMDGVDTLMKELQKETQGLIFVNLVDFDAQFGHRRDPSGYKNALEDFDRRMPEMLQALKEDDLLIITADHGNDPTHHGTDHTREYVPLLVYEKGMKQGVSLGIRETFSDVGATIADNFGVRAPVLGTSFLSEIK